MSKFVKKGQRCKLLVTIERAQNLRAADKNLLGPGTSDPYVRCRVKDKPFPPELAFKTKTIQKNLNPVWHGEDHLLEPVFSGDALEFEVLDQNSVLTDKSLGKAILEYYQFFPNGYNDSLILSDAGKKETGKATLKVSVECDPIVSAGPYDPRCYVKIVRADNLKAADLKLTKKSSSDPYVICQLVNKPKSIVKTKVVLQNLSPEWDEEFELVGYEIGDDIEFQVMDWDEKDTDPDDPLGDYTLGHNDFFREGGGEYHTELELNNTGMESVSLLEVKVEVDIPEQPKVVIQDPGAHVVRGMTWPVPFTLRSLDSGRTHRLAAYTRIGRSSKVLDPSVDLILNGPGTQDISRLHATIKIWQPPDSADWKIRLYKRGKHGTVRMNFSVVAVPEESFFACGEVRFHLFRTAVATIAQLSPSCCTVSFNDSANVAGRLLDGATSLVQAEIEIPPDDNNWKLTETLNHRLQDMYPSDLGNLLSQCCDKEAENLAVLGLQPFTFPEVSGILCEVDTMVGPDWICGSCEHVNDGRNAYCDACGRPGEGLGAGPGGGHAGGGTSVGDVQVDGMAGLELKPGDSIRFGKNEHWVLDKASLFARSNLASIATRHIAEKPTEDPHDIRVLRVPNIASHHALRGCKTWFDLSRVVLEWLGEPDEPPCVEAIEIEDECGGPVSKHIAQTLEEQEVYPVQKILGDVRIGMTIRLKLCSDPCLLAPVLAHLEAHRRRLEKIYSDRDAIPD